MIYTVVDCEQRSPEWFQARLGRLTGSSAADMLATIKSGEAAARRNLRRQLVLERLTQKLSWDDVVTTAAMQRGIDLEPAARAKYAAVHGEVAEVGFLQHPTLMAGCSPDGLLEDKLIEIKCPGAANHLNNIRGGWPAYQYEKQILHNLWISGVESCDFISYHPDFPEPLDMFVVTVWRDDAAIVDYERKARAFLYEVDRELDYLKGLLDVA